MPENDETNGEPLESPVSEASLARSTAPDELLSLDTETDTKRLEQILDDRIELYRKLALKSLQLTSVRDWVDQNGVPYLQASGAEKLMKLWGISIPPPEMEIQMNMETGLPSYKVTGMVSSRVFKNEMWIIGGRDANDPWFSKQTNLSLLDVQKAAASNFYDRAIKSIIGINGLTWEEIEDMTQGRITRAKATGKVEYKKKGQEPGATPPAAPSPTGSSPPPNQAPAPSGFISEGQQKRLFAIAYQAGWKNDELKKFLKDTWGIDSSSKVPKGDYDQIITDIQAGGSH